MGMLQEALEFLADQRLEADGVEITYIRGTDFNTFTAIRENATEKTQDDRYAEWLIKTADLIIGGIVDLPQVDDEIAYDDETWVVADVENLNSDNSHFRFCDPGRYMLRVHTIKEL